MTTLPQDGLGPFHDQRQAQDAVRHITALPPGTGAWAAACGRLLLDADESAGIELGGFDREVLAWAASFEPWAVAVFAGLDGSSRSSSGAVAVSKSISCMAEPDSPPAQFEIPAWLTVSVPSPNARGLPVPIAG